MERAELKFIKDAFSQIIDDIAGNPDWHDAASAVSADLGALERELERKMENKNRILKDAVAGTVHLALNFHYIMTDQEAVNARLRGIPEGTVVDIFICEAEEEQ